MSLLTRVKAKTIDGFRRSINQKPAYVIGKNGIRVEWHDFSDPTSLPFDRDTFENSNLFLGDYANPWSVDFDSIAEEYGEEKDIEKESLFGNEKTVTVEYIDREKVLEALDKQITNQVGDSDEIPLSKGPIPVDFDIEAIAREYDEFGHEDPLTDLVEEKHVIPSQKYKAYMNQAVLTETFQASAFPLERMKYVLYMILGAVGFQLLITVT